MILASICMRGGSKGVPMKNSKLLHGKPLMQFTIDCAKKSKLLDDIVISSDNLSILDMASNFVTQEKLYHRKIELATDASSKWDVFKDLVLRYEEKNNIKVTYLVDLDVTVPLRLPSHIDGCINLMNNSDSEVIITGYEPERNPYFNMMEIQQDGTAVIVKKSPHPIVCRQDAPMVFSLTPAVYVIKRDVLFTREHWSHAKCRIHPIPRNLAVDIDTPFDFNLVEFLMTHEK